MALTSNKYKRSSLLGVSSASTEFGYPNSGMLLRHYLSKHRLCVHTTLLGQIPKTLRTENSMDINELKKQMIPYWRDIYNLQYGNIFKQLFVRIKYRIFGNRFGTSEIPDNILEAIARTMLPDIREFFLSKEGQAEFAAWKAEQEKKNKK